MAIAITILSAVLVAAVAPLVHDQRSSWWRRLVTRWTHRSAVAAPQRVRNDAGWQLIQCDNSESFRRWLGVDSEGLPQDDQEPDFLGSHLLIELLDCDPKSLEAEREVGSAMVRAAEASKATIVEQSFHEFKPFGVSGAVIIQESHYTIHTWPEHGYAAVDLFYCGGTVHVAKAVDVLVDRFRPKRMKFLVVRRGIDSEVIGR